MNIIEWAFGKSMTPQERLRKHINGLKRTIRELDKETISLQRKETLLTKEIKKSAAAGQMNAAKIQAKDLVRTRGYITKFQTMSAEVTAISLQLKTISTNEAMMSGMKNATSALKNMNRTTNLPALQRVAMEFEKENDLMGQRQEVIEDAMDEVTGLEEEDEPDEIVNKILEEIGVDIKYSVGATPQGIQGTAVPEGKVAQAIGGGADPGDDDLQARLNSLRR